MIIVLYMFFKKEAGDVENVRGRGGGADIGGAVHRDDRGLGTSAASALMGSSIEVSTLLKFVMPGRERIFFALDVPGIHVFAASKKDVDGRDKPGHNAERPCLKPLI